MFPVRWGNGALAGAQSGAVDRFADLPEVLHAYGFPRWKHPIVRQCFPGHRIVFAPRGRYCPQCSAILLWGMSPVPFEPSAEVIVLRIEDGFLRSVGLGADLVRPVSWVVDRQGLHYDATRPSALESLLVTRNFDIQDRLRAEQLRAQIVATGLTKYNVGHRHWRRPEGVCLVILVPGQVESDASLAYGAPGERTNMGLLRRVRDENPDAYIVYKPHPDVLARLRKQGRDEHEAKRWCDEVVSDASMGDLLGAVDEVHVLTSLAGFEALLRGRAVTCYGQPFYAGWGLTRDIVPIARRTRRLSLDELVAGALIHYPLYLSRDGRRLISPEEAYESLCAWLADTQGRDPWWRAIFRVLLRRIAGVR